MDAIRKMGPLTKIVQMLPLGSLGVEIPDGALQSTKETLERFKVVMDSMTDEELDHPRIIRSSRIKRIARGSGVTSDYVRELLKYHKTIAASDERRSLSKRDAKVLEETKFEVKAVQTARALRGVQVILFFVFRTLRW